MEQDFIHASSASQGWGFFRAQYYYTLGLNTYYARSSVFPDVVSKTYNLIMDDTQRKQFEEEMMAFEESLMQSGMETEVKNGFLKAVSLMNAMHMDTQMAHLRIDHRKDELKAMKKSIEALTEKISIMSDKISKLTDSQTGLIKLFNNNIEVQCKQMDEQKRHMKRITFYISAVSLISLIGTFGSLKGASVASAIWSVLGKLL